MLNINGRYEDVQYTCKVIPVSQVTKGEKEGRKNGLYLIHLCCLHSAHHRAMLKIDTQISGLNWKILYIERQTETGDIEIPKNALKNGVPQTESFDFSEVSISQAPSIYPMLSILPFPHLFPSTSLTFLEFLWQRNIKNWDMNRIMKSRKNVKCNS